MREGEARARRWRDLLPARWGWVRLAASPSSYLLLVALAVTAAAKGSILPDLHGVGAWPLWWIAVSAADAAFYAGLAALFALGERRVPWLLAGTVPLAVLVAALAAINGAYLGITGEQLTWQALSLGLDRFGDVTGIVGEEASRLGARAALLGLALVAVPAAALWALRRADRPLHPAADAGERAHAAGLVAALALLVALVAPAGDTYALERLGGNAVVRTYWGWLTDDPAAGDEPVSFQGYEPQALVRPAAIDALRAGARPNVVLLVLESTRRDATQLAGPDAPARTPNLVALAGRGLEVTHARAVVPHTTKSLFTMLCGRLPLMQLAIYEGADSVPIQCLPEVLAAAGWRTGFLQSAIGVFEDRARLVRSMGYQRFAAWEDLGGEPLGYLASDDASLAPALARFLDEGPAGQPFFATLLTSAPHHPYRLPARVAARVAAEGRPAGTARERYDRLVEEEDRLLGEVLALLEARGLADRTIVIAVGDHGEGFGERGIRQHDNNFFEEGLRVPWVMAGPGVPRRRVDGDASLVDLTPTVLAALGVEMAPETAATTPGRSLLGGAPEGRMLVFSCFYDTRCRGFVSRGRKAVFIPEASQAFWFDLSADPDERAPRPLGGEIEALFRDAHRQIDAHRTRSWPDERRAMDAFPPWECPAGARCRHPKSPPGGMFSTD